MKRKYYSWPVLLVFIFSGWSFSYLYAQQKYFRYYTTDDGLPSSTIPSAKPNTIYQDKDGFIWFATFGGVSIYDGYHFKNHTKENGSLTSDIVFGFFERNSNEVWVMEPPCIDVFVNRKKVRSIPILGYLTTNYLSTRDGRILTAREGAVFEIRDYKPVRIASFPKEVSWMDETGDYFLLQNFNTDSLFLVDHSFQKIIESKKGQIFKDGQNRIWYFNSQFYLLDTLALQQGVFKLLPAPEPLNKITLEGKQLADFLPDSDGFYWIITKNEKAVNRKGENGVTRINAQGDTMHFNIRADHFFEDADRNIWVSYDAGFLRFSNKYSDFFGEAEGMSNERVTGIAVDDRNDAAWIANQQGISCIFKSHVFNFPKPVKDWTRLSILGDSLWVAGDRLILYKISYQPNPQIRLLKQWKPDGDEGIWRFQPDRDGSMFINKDKHGLFRATMDGKIQKLHPPVLYAFYIDGDELWTGDYHQHIDTIWSDLTRWKMIREKDSIRFQFLQRYSHVPGGRLNSMTKDAAGNFWIGTINEGVVKLEKKKDGSFLIRNYYSKAGLSNPWVSKIIINDQGEIFAALFGGGVYQIHEVKDSFYFEDLTARYGGVLSTWDFVEDTKRNFWLATPIGVVHVHNDLYKKSLSPNVFFTQLMKNNQPDSAIFNTGVSKKFSHNENNLVFEFSAPSFRDESKVLYSYLLEKDHASAEWSVPKPIHTVSLLSLSPGSYKMKVKAVTAENVWSDVPAQYSFNVASPYWATWWFRALVVLVIAALVYFFYRYRMNQLKKLLAIRTKISRDLHDEVGSTLSGIGLLSEVAMQQLDNEKKAEAKSSLHKINDSSEEMLEKISDIVWAINPQNDSFENVISKLRTYAKTTTDSLGIQLHFNSGKDVEQFNLDMQRRNSIYLICKEAINNAVKYSDCHNLNFALQQHDHQISISIADDGKGFDIQKDFDGNGLKNMQARAREIKADLNLHSEKGKGTSVKLSLNIT